MTRHQGANNSKRDLQLHREHPKITYKYINISPTPKRVLTV